jgi:hypothetical protein
MSPQISYLFMIIRSVMRSFSSPSLPDMGMIWFETDEDKILIRRNGSTSGEMTLRPDVLQLAHSSFHYLCDSFHVLVRLQMMRLSEFFERVAGRSALTRFNAP